MVKLKAVLFLVALYLAMGPIAPLSAQMVLEPPAVAVATEVRNHRFESFHFTQSGGYAFVDDGSVWYINPQDIAWIKKEPDKLLNIPITLMPEAGTDSYPVRIIVHTESWGFGWRDLTAKQAASPMDPHGTTISGIDKEDGAFVSIKSNALEESFEETLLLINPLDAETVKRWKPGQKVVIGGVWFPEYDPYGRKEYNCGYLFVLYNYETKTFAFFAI